MSGQHRCRQWYAQSYLSDESYCGWLYANQAQTYCWAMDDSELTCPWQEYSAECRLVHYILQHIDNSTEEWQCTDGSCGYGGKDQPNQATRHPVKCAIGRKGTFDHLLFHACCKLRAGDDWRNPRIVQTCCLIPTLAVVQTYTAVASKRIKKLATGIGGSMESAALTRRPGVASFNVNLNGFWHLQPAAKVTG